MPGESHGPLDIPSEQVGRSPEATGKAPRSHLRARFTSVRDARRELAALQLEAGLKEDMELVVSELATNAVVHAGAGPFSLQVSCGPRWARVEVGDSSSAMPVMSRASTTGGRGLRIVDRLATTWGVDRSGPGKLVWAELERPRRRRR